jgi:hypothetical protein
MSDFERIPEAVFELFREIFWADPENLARPAELTPDDRWKAMVVAWGWDPPLIQEMSARDGKCNSVLTKYGLAAYAWRKLKSTDESPLSDDFRSGPGGPLLTVKVCRDRFGISGPALSQDKQARATRKKNGRGYVYRYDVVSRMANRKSGDE